MVVLLAAGTVYAAPLRAVIEENFTGSTAPGWNISGSAVLTGNGVIDPVGDGWLRLSANTNWQAGTAIKNTTFSSTEGVNISFDYATYGGNGADGFTFYLIDGATANPTLGAPGGALGYSWDSNENDPGVTNGYVGIGFDEYGNFSTPIFGDCNPSCPGYFPNSVTIRGSGSLFSGFNFLTRASIDIGTTNRAGAKSVRINITPAPDVKISVQLDSGSGFVTVIDNFDLSSATGQAALPATFKMGFSGSTGGLNNFHEIRNSVVVEGSDTGDGPPSVGSSVPADGETLNVGISQLQVAFDEGISLDTATDVQNYILIEANGDGGFESGDCNNILNGTGVASTDTRITIIDAAYSSSHWTSTLTLASELPVGTYRLLVCGTTSIEDLGGNELNDGMGDTSISFAIEDPSVLPRTGFPMGRVTNLSPRLGNISYTETAITLEVPSLGIEMPIVYVPKSDGSWDVTWLGNNAGYLAGSAFPTWPGNTVITGHVWDASNNPGSFSALKTLNFGDLIHIKAFGQVYTYEVREKKLVLPDHVSSVFEHKEYDWITLLTCELFHPFTNDYFFRRMVQAVLIDVK